MTRPASRIAPTAEVSDATTEATPRERKLRALKESFGLIVPGSRVTSRDYGWYGTVKFVGREVAYVYWHLKRRTTIAVPPSPYQGLSDLKLVDS